MDPCAPSLQQLHFPCPASSSSAVLLQQLLQLQQSFVQPTQQSLPRQIPCQNATAFPSAAAGASANVFAVQPNQKGSGNNFPSHSHSSSSSALLDNNLPSAAAFFILQQNQQQQQQKQQKQQVFLLGRLFQCHWPSAPPPAPSLGQSVAAAALLMEEEKRTTTMPNATKVREMVKAEEHSAEKRHKRRAKGETEKTEADTKPAKVPITSVSCFGQNAGGHQHQSSAVVVGGRLGFSIDGLLASGGAASTTKVDYFMEEEELSWTDGRRGRKTQQNGPSKEMAEPKATLKKKHPPLPSASCGKHVCAECGKSYATSSNLSRHKQTHRSWEHAKKCLICGKEYVSMPALSMHLLTHNRQHKCDICGKKFSRPWLLKGHIRSHTGNKPFGCGICGKAFSDKSNLRAHLNTHNNEKRWHCEHCGRVFNLRSYLSKHLEHHHQNNGTKATEEMGTALPSDGLR